ncbi:hypothetical protein DFJ73DRAFT_570488 [Zopfochytrium polystomum]|nr:hypothetical protein DFJ73DRAFT_570488 [Zopfochytrium polystomum]
MEQGKGKGQTRQSIHRRPNRVKRGRKRCSEIKQAGKARASSGVPPNCDPNRHKRPLLQRQASVFTPCLLIPALCCVIVLSPLSWTSSGLVRANLELLKRSWTRRSEKFIARLAPKRAAPRSAAFCIVEACKRTLQSGDWTCKVVSPGKNSVANGAATPKALASAKVSWRIYA